MNEAREQAESPPAGAGAVTNMPTFSTPRTSWNLATGGQVTSTRNQPRLLEFSSKFSY